jgi:hypothetical protein
MAHTELCKEEYVDDTDLVHSGLSNDDTTAAADVITGMQDMLDHWDGLLHTPQVEPWNNRSATGITRLINPPFGLERKKKRL